MTTKLRTVSTGRGRRPTAAMPQAHDYAYECGPCTAKAGRQVWIGGFSTEQARDDGALRHHYEQHSTVEMLASPTRWLGCGEFECVCGPYGPPCGHPRHNGCAKAKCTHPDGPRLRREFLARKAAQREAVESMAWHLANSE